MLTLHANELAITTARLFRADGRGEAVPLAIDLRRRQADCGVARAGPARARRLSRRPAVHRQDQHPAVRACSRSTTSTSAPARQVRGLFTQFEAPDARRFAPMFDEPSYKATFDLSATVPANQMAVGNMPIAGRGNADGTGARRSPSAPARRCRATCCSSPPAISSGSRQGPGRRRRRHRQPGGQRRAGALGARRDPRRCSRYYNDYFGVPYPLPKLDNVAAPGESQFFGAMENWGAILTFERVLLLDPTMTDPATQNYLYTAQAHEIAHQWFGDIVTMAWWDDLWLNEGFASWMETKATARFQPDWFPLLDARRTGARRRWARRVRHHPPGGPEHPHGRRDQPGVRRDLVLRRARRSSRCSRPMPARTCGATASAPTSSGTAMRTP